MPGGQDIANALFGAWRLLRFDVQGLAFFDDSIDGFWKSFFAAVIIAPAYLIQIFLDPDETQAGAVRQLLVHVIAYSIGWTAYPLVAHYICEALGRQADYLRFIVAFNWSKVLQVALILPAMLLSWGGILGTGGGNLVVVMVTLYAVVYQWFVTKTALRLSGIGAVAFVVLDLIIEVMIMTVMQAMLS